MAVCSDLTEMTQRNQSSLSQHSPVPELHTECVIITSVIQQNITTNEDHKYYSLFFGVYFPVITSSVGMISLMDFYQPTQQG